MHHQLCISPEACPQHPDWHKGSAGGAFQGLGKTLLVLEQALKPEQLLKGLQGSCCPPPYQPGYKVQILGVMQGLTSV